jgi:hypothetical protein
VRSGIAARATHLVALVAFAVAGCVRARTMSLGASENDCDWHLKQMLPSTVGTQAMSPTIDALYAVGNVDDFGRGYIILARGQPNWYTTSPVTGGGKVDGPGDRKHTWQVGSLSYSVSYDATNNTVDLLGTTVSLDSANVLLVDHVDQVGDSARLVGAGCLMQFDLERPDLAIRNGRSKIQAFLQGSP